ncbi:TIGR03118 family protein [Sphingomonas tabacisoli]|uniref:TIGR03118 family protein n=1 Tax=Sphingomonas tabacisoli TaxID=2249466 RepID=A0ABW4I486_9SPHN
MHVHRLAPCRAVLFGTASAFSLLCSSVAWSASQRVAQTNLVTDDAAFLASQGFAPAATVDASLINPWGTSFSATSPFWVSNQGAGNATLYNGAGAKQGLTVTMPSFPGGPNGPTGQVFNSTTNDFVLAADGAKATFLFANLNGAIQGWNNGLGTTAANAVLTPGAVYTGLALGNSGGQNFLYAANVAQNRIDVFNSGFMLTSLAGSFTDPTLPAGLAPFNVANIGGQLYVTYAPPQDADEAPLGTGVVDVFNTDGTFVRRFATGGNLLSPWGVARAPASFGVFGNAILVGNFAEDDGFINAFRESDGTYLGMLNGPGGDPFKMPYLWSLAFRTGGAGVDPNALYFTAGIGDEMHGLFGRLNAIPEPAAWAMMVAGFALAGWAVRKSRPQVVPG